MTGASERGLARARKVAAFPGQGVALYKSMYDTHTRLASQFAARIGLDDVTCRALRETYEQWDGKGGPRKLMGEEVSLPARIVQLADLTEVTYRRAALTPPASTRASDAGGISTRRWPTCSSPRPRNSWPASMPPPAAGRT
ncbi:MAG: HD domain-containing phosphohydrolase [Nocardioidaceae bacterium]